MIYNLANLSHADFEDLVRDLIGRELKMRFEAFGPGPDGGMDGRHSRGGRFTILQAKHYIGSTAATLVRRLRKERPAIDRLAPKRYILATSRPLTPPNKKQLARAIGPALKRESDIFGPADLEGLLRAYPQVAQAHIKLWLSGAPILERILRSATYSRSRLTREDIERKVRLYAANASFNRGLEILEKQHVLIVSGSPGVGKSTLAEMLAYRYMAEGWELAVIRTLDDGFATLSDAKNQIYLFDDFLGKVALDPHALAHNDSDLAKLIRKVRQSPNARFLLTTRAYIFEEARTVSEHLADKRLDVMKYVLDVSQYTRSVRARILYNHLDVSGIPRSHIRDLIESKCLAKVVDHRNYNPRIVEWMTDVTHVGEIESHDYPTAFIALLDNPKALWDVAFRKHIRSSCRHLLIALYFYSQYGVELETLRIGYESLHERLSERYGEPRGPKDFEESLKILESGFISIRGSSVSFVNPSLRDYLKEYLSDFRLLCEAARASLQTNWAAEVWVQGRELELKEVELEEFARCFVQLVPRMITLPVWMRTQRNGLYQASLVGLSNMQRVELLIEWWDAAKEPSFLNAASDLVKNPIGGILDSWLDGTRAIELLGKIREGSFDQPFPIEQFASDLEASILEMIGHGMSSDLLESIADSVENSKEFVGQSIVNAVENAIRQEFSDVQDVVNEIDSEGSLEEHRDSLKRLGARMHLKKQEIDKAVSVIDDRIAELSEETTPAPSPSKASLAREERFTDEALHNLFAPLIQSV